MKNQIMIPVVNSNGLAIVHWSYSSRKELSYQIALKEFSDCLCRVYEDNHWSDEWLSSLR